jgi:cytidylate kinase
VLYRAYSCRAGAYQPVQELAAQPLVILEGSYSHHPLLAGYETLQVFVTCSREAQTRRLQAREGARYPAFAQRWIPLEEGYFAKYSIEESADLILDAEKGMIEATKS